MNSKEQVLEARKLVHRVEVCGQHGSMPDYWREPLENFLHALIVERDTALGDIEEASSVFKRIVESYPMAIQFCRSWVE